MEIVGTCVENAEKETYLCCLKMKPFRTEGVVKLREILRRMIDKEIAEVGKSWKEDDSPRTEACLCQCITGS